MTIETLRKRRLEEEKRVLHTKVKQYQREWKDAMLRAEVYGLESTGAKAYLAMAEICKSLMLQVFEDYQYLATEKYKEDAERAMASV